MISAYQDGGSTAADVTKVATHKLERKNCIIGRSGKLRVAPVVEHSGATLHNDRLASSRLRKSQDDILLVMHTFRCRIRSRRL